MDKTKETEQLKRELETLRDEYQSLQQKASTQQQQYEDLKLEHESFKQQHSVSSSTQSTHSTEFWNDVYRKCKTDEDYIKSLINDKILTMAECDECDRTLLLIAAKRGSYELVRLCLNLHADINKTDRNGKSALDHARDGAWTHVEQLLLFSKMEANIGKQLRDTAHTINKQKGIAQNIMNQISSYDADIKDLIESTLVDTMINILKKKQSFSDDILNLCWDIECKESRNPLSTKLWQTIVAVCKDTVENSNQKDWFWFKKFILPSTIWFKNINEAANGTNDEGKEDEKDRKYLYYELLKLVENKASDQLDELKHNLNVLSTMAKSEWQNLISWDIPDEYKEIRQDKVPNGIVCRFTHNELAEQGSSSASFNAHRFYDYHNYLPQLVLLAHIVDDDFQKSIQDIFNIDRYTKIGQINDNIVEYNRGPVKLIERAKSKAANDYSTEIFPTSACVLDFNRSSLVFHDIATLLYALKLFQNKVHYYQSGCIIAIVRDKNGFQKYANGVRYADIKLNVLIRGTHNNIIGEVQFLLKTMKDYKVKAHNLYSIQRQKQFMERSVSSILPLLLNEHKQLFVAGNKGDVTALCNLMVINNKNEQDIMQIDEESRESILLNISALGNYNAFKFLRSVIPNELMVTRLFDPNRYNENAIEAAVGSNGFLILKDILSINEVQRRYKNDKDMLFRFLFWLFSACDNEAMIDYALKQLNVLDDLIAEMVGYRIAKPTESFASSAYVYHTRNIVNKTSGENTVSILRKLETIIGTKAFVNYVLVSDLYDVNALERAIENGKFDTVKYLLSIDAIVDEYKNMDDLRMYYRLIYWLFCKCNSEEIHECVLNTINVSKERMIGLMSYKYPKAEGVESNGYAYNNYNIIARIIRGNTLNNLKKMVNIVGDEVLIENVFKSDGYNVIALEFSIRKNKLDVMKYLLSFKKIKERCLENTAILWRMVYRMNKHYDEVMVKFVMDELELDETKLKEIQTYRFEDKSDQFAANAWTLWNSSISDEAIDNLLNTK